MSKDKKTEMATTGNVTTAIATATMLKELGFMLATMSPEKVTEVIQGNFRGETLTPDDLDRLRIPAGGAPMWMVPGLEGLMPTPTLEVIVVDYSTQRAQWSSSLEDSGGGSPPDCSSSDGKTGIGEPGGMCGIPKTDSCCPLNEFGSADKGEGKSCKEFRVLLCVMPDCLMPRVVVLPPSSLKPWKTYLQRLTSHMVPFDAVMTKISLTEQTSRGGQKFSQAKFEVGKQLDRGSIAHVAALTKPMIEVFKAVKVDSTDAAGGSSAPADNSI